MSIVLPKEIPDEPETIIEQIKPKITAYQINFVYQMAFTDYLKIVAFFGSAIFVAMIIAVSWHSKYIKVLKNELIRL